MIPEDMGGGVDMPQPRRALPQFGSRPLLRRAAQEEMAAQKETSKLFEDAAVSSADRRSGRVFLRSPRRFFERWLLGNRRLFGRALLGGRRLSDWSPVHKYDRTHD